MPDIVLPGPRLHYRDEGRGTALVLLHGLGASLGDWDFQFPVFTQHFRVIAPDLRGYGASERAGDYRVARFADDVWKLLDALGVERFDLVGHSMGGAVAMQMGVDHPARIRRLVLADTLPSFHANTPGKRMLFGYRYAMMGLFGPQRLSRAVARRLFPRPEHEALRRRSIARGLSNDRGVYLETIRKQLDWSVEDRLDRLSMPALVIAAEHDYFPVADAEVFARGLPNATLKIIEGAHHVLPLEMPEAFNAEVLSFLGAGRAAAKSPPASKKVSARKAHR